VNFFVELERFLGSALDFIFWVLTSDHYAITKFTYEKTSNQAEMARTLSDYQTKSGAAEPIRFSEEGKNTLYPLIAGFRLFAELCRELLREGSRYVRPSAQTPGYVGRAGLNVFPFTHTKLILDLRDNICTPVISHLIEISELLQNANVAGIRNRTEHARDDFPAANEISAMLDVVSSLADRMQKSGFAPLSYVSLGSKVDRWGRSFRAFGNYRGDTILIHRRGELADAPVPSGPGPIIIVPLIKLGDTEEIFRVRYTEPSDFREMWKGYPIKGTQAPPALISDELIQESAGEPSIRE
jgi:hypothetical protein